MKVCSDVPYVNLMSLLITSRSRSPKQKLVVIDDFFFRCADSYFCKARKGSAGGQRCFKVSAGQGNFIIHHWVKNLSSSLIVFGLVSLIENGG